MLCSMKEHYLHFITPQNYLRNKTHKTAITPDPHPGGRGRLTISSRIYFMRHGVCGYNNCSIHHGSPVNELGFCPLKLSSFLVPPSHPGIFGYDIILCVFDVVIGF